MIIKICECELYIYIRSLFFEDVRYSREFSNKFTRLVYSGFKEFRQIHSLSIFLFFFFFRSYKFQRLKHTWIRRDLRRYRTALVKELVLFVSLVFFFIFFCFFFCNSMLSMRLRVSRLQSSSTSHYVRAKKISREFHTSFSHPRPPSPPSSFFPFYLSSSSCEYFEITVCIKSSRTFNGRSYHGQELFAKLKNFKIMLNFSSYVLYLFIILIIIF